MTSTAILALFLLGLYAAVSVVRTVLSKSMQSYESAERASAELSKRAVELLDEDIPPEAAKLVVMLSYLAGCGCFVRGMLMAHYLPRGAMRRAKPSPELETAFQQINDLPADVERKFAEFLATVMVYDSYRNPLQGMLFRRALRIMQKPELSVRNRLETQLAAMSVVSRKSIKTA